jgi:glycosyltransferase domain-containing protein
MNHTLVIPTYNRPELVRRLVAYYRLRSTPVELLVLDSSKPEIAEANAQWFAVHEPAVRHMVFPGTTQVAAKLALGLAHVTTPYVSFCADDDVVFPQGIGDAVRFLAGNLDYVCAHGLYLNFRVGPSDSERAALLDRADDFQLDLHVWREYGGPANDAGHPGARIFRLFQNYESLFYAAFRTADLRDIFAGVPGIPSLHFQELFQSVAALIKGKVWRFPGLYAARQSCTPAEPERNNWQTYYWFAENAGELVSQYSTYCNELWRFYEAHGRAPRLDRAAFQRALDLAHAVYFSKGCPPDYFYSTLQAYWPADPYVQPAAVDLFGQMGTDAPPAPAPLASAAAPSRWTLRYVRDASRLVLRAARTTPYRISLDWRVRRLGGSPWKLRLPWSVCWLSVRPEFRRTYLELCLYLDSR